MHDIKTYNYIATIAETAEINLFGDIGYDLDGNTFANELSFLANTDDVKEVVLHINSGGGDVLQGLSIIAAINNCKKKTIGIVEGVAGSMAGVILASCNYTKALDYSKIMLHSVIGEEKTAKELQEILEDIYNKRVNDVEKIKMFMSKTSWLTAEEAKNYGIIDEIITDVKKDIFLNRINKLNKNSNFMEEQEKLLSEIMQLLEVENKDEIIKTINELLEDKKELELLKTEQEQEAETEVNSIVENLIKLNIADEKDKELLKEVGKKNKYVLQNMLNSVNKQTKKVQEVIKKEERNIETLVAECKAAIRKGNLKEFKSKLTDKEYLEVVNRIYNN